MQITMKLELFIRGILLICIHSPFTAAIKEIKTHTGRVRASKSVPPGRPSLNWDNYLLQPSFAEDNIHTVVAAAGNTAFVHCKINHLADRAVTWIRKADVQVLTVNTFTYTSDPRISAYSSSSGDEWVLKIVGARLDDTGGYECQVSTDPKMSMTFYLHVVVAYAEIEGQREVFMNSGGNLDLTCAVPRITQPPEFILWYNGSKIINYSNRPEVMIKMSRRNKSSRLTMVELQGTDSGNYTCVPSNAKPASVIVHIVQEEKPAAMQTGDNGSSGVWQLKNQFGFFSVLIVSLFSQPIIWCIFFEFPANNFRCSRPKKISTNLTSNQCNHEAITGKFHSTLRTIEHL